MDFYEMGLLTRRTQVTAIAEVVKKKKKKRLDKRIKLKNWNLSDKMWCVLDEWSEKLRWGCGRARPRAIGG